MAEDAFDGHVPSGASEVAEPAVAHRKEHRSFFRRFLRHPDTQYAPPRIGAAIERPKLFGQALIFGTLLFFIIAILWAHWAILNEVTIGEGHVIPSQHVQIVQNFEGGIIKKIAVHEGEVVKTGQVLLQLENSNSVANLGELRAKYYGLLGAVSRLRAEAHQKPLTFPPELLAENRKIAERERRLYMAQQSDLQGKIAVIEQQVDQKQQELDGLKSSEKNLVRGVHLLKEQISINEPLVKTGVVPRIDYLKLQGNLNDKVSQLDNVKSAIQQAQAALREANRRIEEQYLGFRSDAQKELTQQQTQLEAVEQGIYAAQDRVQRTEVRSPVRGIVKTVKVNTIGGVVKPGMDLVEIVPIDDTLLVEAKIRPRDIAFIRPNQSAVVKISAYDFSVYGGLKAKVERISADTISAKDDLGRTERYYKIIVRTDKNYLGTKQHPLPIIPGMVATVDILTGKKSVLDYLLKPILKARERALTER